MKKSEVIGSPSAMIDGRIAELGDWRGETLAKVRAVIRKADAAIVEDFLRRAPLMEAARTRQMAERILEGIASQDPDFLGPVRLREPVDRLREALGVEN